MSPILSIGLPVLFTLVVIAWVWLELVYFAGDKENDSDENEKDNL